MTNEELNERKINNAEIKKQAFYYKRSGKCDPNICGSACCRFSIGNMFDDEYYQKITVSNTQAIKILKYKKNNFLVTPFHCPDITIDGKCKFHDSKKQSKICSNFPMVHTDPMYIFVRKFCGYKFEYTRTEVKA